VPKGKHANYARIELPNGAWLLIYDDGRVKIAKYNARMRVTEVLNRAGGSHVFIQIADGESGWYGDGAA